jgi:hypothetical protein
MQFKTYTNRLEALGKGFPMQYGIFIPGDIAEELTLKANTRLVGSLNGLQFRLASLSDGAGQFYITVSKPLQKSAGLKPGQMVTVQIAVDPEPDRLDIPEEFEELLQQDPEVKAIFETLTIGYRRSILHYISGAKGVDTRIKRSLELAERMRNGMPGAKIKE